MIVVVMGKEDVSDGLRAKAALRQAVRREWAAVEEQSVVAHLHEVRRTGAFQADAGTTTANDDTTRVHGHCPQSTIQPPRATHHTCLSDWCVVVGTGPASAAAAG
jgi:hypothetical protein